MDKASKFIELNNFIQAENGVFHRNVMPEEFEYSDGVVVEKEIYYILDSATDLSSESQELQAKIVDWPTEYHLSSARSNLLRILNLTGAERVLELGCGCGSITRYLGEQDNLVVDSVEGSPERASLAALRCRDLDNVSIATANFNDLELPDNYYDLVLFVGVTEYAGRFSKRETDQEALQDLLSIAHRALKPNGVSIVAIENRVGLKYLHGATEDHYGHAYIGLQNYPDSEGIRTYSKNEWLEQINKSSFDVSKFFYPFPDYKVPTVVFDESVANDPSKIEALLKNNQSRDYISEFSLGQHELSLWTALSSAGTLDDHANSFLILMANETADLDNIVQVSELKNDVPLPSYLDSKFSSDIQVNDIDLQTAKQYEQQSKRIEQLNTEVEELRGHLKLIQGSKGEKALNFLRRCIGRASNANSK